MMLFLFLAAFLIFSEVGGEDGRIGPDSYSSFKEVDALVPNIIEMNDEIPMEVDFDCGEGMAEDYRQVYPPTIIDIADTYFFEEMGGVLTRFETVLFDKYSLAVFLEIFKRDGGLKGVKSVFDPGTGTGALALAALAHGVESAVATELDPLALKNAMYNARQLGVEERFEGRLVPFEDQQAFSVVGDDEKFDLIVCDPPQGYKKWHVRSYPDVSGNEVEKLKEIFFSVDPEGCFLVTLVNGLNDHLAEGGRALIAMKVRTGILILEQLAMENGFQVEEIFSVTRDLDIMDMRVIGSSGRNPDLSQSMKVFELTRASN